MHAIQKEIHVAATVKEAYEALSTPRGIKGWWSVDSKVGQEVGERTTMRFEKFGSTVAMEFEVEALEPDARVIWSCTANGNPLWVGTTLEFSVAASGDETVVHLNHHGFADNKSPLFERTDGGWDHFTSSLKSYLETGVGEPW